MADIQPRSVFRKKTLDSISSPEQLSDYLRVTDPGIWVVLAAVILLVAGVFAWAAVGTIETTAGATVIVKDHRAEVIISGAETISEGMVLRTPSKETVISSAQTDEYGRSVGIAEIELPDGTYNGKVVVESIHPISFLLESR